MLCTFKNITLSVLISLFYTPTGPQQALDLYLPKLFKLFTKITVSYHEVQKTVLYLVNNMITCMFNIFTKIIYFIKLLYISYHKFYFISFYFTVYIQIYPLLMKSSSL